MFLLFVVSYFERSLAPPSVTNNKNCSNKDFIPSFIPSRSFLCRSLNGHGHGSPLAELALGVLYAVGLAVQVGIDAALEHVAGFGLQVTLAAVCRYCDCDVLHIAVLF